MGVGEMYQADGIQSVLLLIALILCPRYLVPLIPAIHFFVLLILDLYLQPLAHQNPLSSETSR